jgi:hypothetical protein
MASGGEAPQGPPVSLSLSLKKKGRAVPAPAAAGFEAVESAEKARTEEVKEVADGHVGEKAPERVIPALPNSFGNLSGLSAASEPGPAADAAVAGAGSKLERDDATPGPAAAAIPAQRAPLDEDAAAAHALLQEAQMDDEARYRCDVAMRADQASDEAYESMPIEEFGRAMLRGMGWKEGEGYNGKPAVEPIEYVARPQLLGLAATPAPEAAPGRQKKYIKPGESREKKKDMVRCIHGLHRSIMLPPQLLHRVHSSLIPLSHKQLPDPPLYPTPTHAPPIPFGTGISRRVRPAAAYKKGWG